MVFKRLFDFILAFILLLLLFPVMIILALLIRVKMGSPVIFRQVRPGYRGEPFCLYKFRTMSVKQGELRVEEDEKRLTGLGRKLRHYSLDELPQLVNVLKGDLSFVGPRPLLMEYLERYSSEQARRHEVKPGITGWAQVNGRNALTWEEKFALDTWYVDNMSFWLDLKILFMTLYKVLQADDVSGEGVATMSEFMGSGEKDSG